METAHSSHRCTPFDLPAFLDVLDAVAAVAVTARPVFFVTRRGTGPLLLAEMVHRASPRAAGKFTVVRCGLSPSSTVDLQLLGSRGSTRRKSSRLSGKILESDGGTLFIEQVQNASPDAQRVLFQILEEHEFTMGDMTRAVDVRIVASAPEILEKYVAEKRFRADLFYRLTAMPIPIPAAMRNREDILGILASAKEHCAEAVIAVTTADRHAASEAASSWKRVAVAVRSTQEALGSNCSSEEVLARTLVELRRIPRDTHRQLESLVLNAASQCVNTHSPLFVKTYDGLLIEFQRALIRQAITECNGILSGAATLLGLTVSEFKTLLDNAGMGS